MIDLGINLFQEIAALGGGGGFNITNSLRFNDNDSAYLSRTPSVAGNRKTWTWSGWVKRGNLGTGAVSLLTLPTIGGVLYDTFGFNTSNQLNYFSTDNGATLSTNIATNSVYRDSSGWYHIVLSVDTTQASSSDRVSIYVNGTKESSFSTSVYPPLDRNTAVNSTNQHRIGAWISSYFDGYMAEVNFIDGQALTADDFGEIDSVTGEWSPKKYSGTYGTNGFYLAFEDGAALGDDTSGNTNDWTPTNLASTDQMLDTPTNNFSALNPNANSGLTLSEGNLKFTSDISNRDTTLATMGVTSGKWYWELLVVDDAIMVGIEKDSNYPIPEFRTGINTDGYAWRIDENLLYHDSSSLGSYGASVSPNDIVGVAFDLDAGTIEYFINNVSQGQAFSGITGGWVPSVSDSANVGAADGTLNFGQDSSFAGNKTRQGNTDSNGIGDFYYEPPTGYLALCTDNLPAPAIEQPETHFNVVTYTGNGGTQSITGVGFQPDFVWAKLRTTSSYHRLHDVVRGSDNTLASNVTDAESIGNGIVSFDADGFTMDSNTNINQSYPYVAWCWKAGGTAVTNTDGAITSQVSANVDAGFSIVGYAGNGSAGTVGHGLSSAPEMIIVKSRNDVTNWPVYHVSTGNTGQTYLSATDAFATSSVRWNNTSPTSSVFSLGTATNVNGSGYNFIAYCFHSVEGFSKFGTYVGNGSTNGPFVYTGFRPAFVMFKCTSQAGSWIIHDTARNPENVSLLHLRANTNAADDSGSNESIDILSNGFKHRGVSNYNANASGQTYIYMAFAEAPFKNAVAR